MLLPFGRGGEVFAARGHKSFAEEGGPCCIAYLYSPRGRRICYHAISKSPRPASEETGELMDIFG